MSAPELRLVQDSLNVLDRRLRHRAGELSDQARQLRRAAQRPTFVAPVGDRSRAFVQAQARRLDRLAQRQRELAGRLRGVSSSLQLVAVLRPAPQRPDEVQDIVEVGMWSADADRPTPRPTTKPLLLPVVDWQQSRPLLEHAVHCCPPTHGPDWEAPTGADEPELPVTGLPGRPPPGRTWILDLGQIRTMTRELRVLADRVEQTGGASRRELAEPEGNMPAELREAVRRVGITTGRVCADVARRLERHAKILERRLETPGLLGPSPAYGLAAFGIDLQSMPLQIDRRGWVELVDADGWHDRAREMHSIMSWLCRRLPVIFGPLAEDFISHGRPPNAHGPYWEILRPRPTPRPPAALPPEQYEVPADVLLPQDMVTDAATGILMSRAEYYRRYGVFYPARPEPLATTPPAADSTGTNLSSGGDSEESIELAEDAASRPVTPPDDVVAEAPHGWSEGDDGVSSGLRSGTGSQGGSSGSETGDGYGGSSFRDGLAAGGGYADSGGSGGSGYTSLPEDTMSGEPLPAMELASAEEPLVPAPEVAGAYGPRDAEQVDKAVRDRQITVPTEAGAALGAVVVAGAGGGTLITKRNAAKKITSWAKYVSTRRSNSEGRQRT